MPVQVSDAFLQTLALSDQKRIATAEVWSGETKLAFLGTVTDGSVSVDVTQQIRRTCSVTIQSQGIGKDNLIPRPTKPQDLLNPASGNELRLFRGFEYPDSTQELCPLGVFRMTKPVVKDTGQAISIAITGNDRSALVSSQVWTDVYPITAGTPLNIALMDLIRNRIGSLVELTFLFAPTLGLTVPATTFGTSLASGNDPMADAVSLATAASMELFFNETGALVLQVPPNPTSASIPRSFSNPPIYSEGVNCTFDEIERTIDETQTYNGVIVIGTGTGGAPVRAEVWDTDPSSPTYYRGPWGARPFIYQTNLVPAPSSTSGSAIAQVASMAQALYLKVHTLLDTPTLQCVPNAALLESDVIRIVRERIGVDADYTISQMTIPMDTATAMSITARPAAGAAAVPPPPPTPPPPSGDRTAIFAVGQTHAGTAVAAYSINAGLTWTTLTTPMDGGQAFGVAIGNSQLMILGEVGEEAAVAITPLDSLGESWVTNDPFGEEAGSGGVAIAAVFVGGEWVLCGDSFLNAIVSSSDGGSTWTPHPSGLDSVYASYGYYSSDGNAIAANDTHVMAVGTNDYDRNVTVVTAAISDLSTWTTRTTPFDPSGLGGGVIWDEGNERWVVVGEAGSGTDLMILNANADGSGSWTTPTTQPSFDPVGGDLTGIASNGVLDLACGGNGPGTEALFSSPTTDIWTYAPSPVDGHTASCVAWDGPDELWLAGFAGTYALAKGSSVATGWTLVSTPFNGGTINAIAVGTLPS